MAATTGWASTTTEAIEAGSRPSAQAIEPWPATWAIASPIQAHQPPIEPGRICSPNASATISITGAVARLDQNMARDAPSPWRARRMAMK